jgi:hypothetical protein
MIVIVRQPETKREEKLKQAADLILKVKRVMAEGRIN